MTEYFPNSKYFEKSVEVKLGLSNYAKKKKKQINKSSKYATGADASKFAERTDLASLKAEVDKSNIEKLQLDLVDLSKLIDLIKKGFVKMSLYDELVKKVDAIQTTDASDTTNLV